MKPNYGIDAPGVIRWLLIFAILCAVIAIFGYRMIQQQHPYMAIGLLIYFLITSISFFIPGIWLLYGTIKAKPRVLHQLVNDLHLKGNEMILDVGCGRGMLLIETAKRLKTGKIHGIDLWFAKDQSGNSSESTLQNAQIEGVADKIELQTADMRSIPFPDQTFDVVVSSLAIHNVEDKEERENVLREIFRVLKKGGRFAIFDFRNAKQYGEIFTRIGASDVKISSPIYQYSPAVRIVTGKKL